jgi:hypothetical protein
MAVLKKATSTSLLIQMHVFPMRQLSEMFKHKLPCHTSTVTMLREEHNFQGCFIPPLHSYYTCRFKIQLKLNSMV